MLNNKIFTLRANAQGYLIPFENNVALSSFEKPEEEARTWKTRAKYYLQSGLPITVFGIGAGIHLQYLHQETILPITVVDTRAGLISWARKVFKDTEIDFIHIEENDSVLNHPLLSETIGYTLPLVFEPGAGELKDFFQLQADHLRGRSNEVWSSKGLNPEQEKHWRFWIEASTETTLEQKILKEVLA